MVCSEHKDGYYWSDLRNCDFSLFISIPRDFSALVVDPVLIRDFTILIMAAGVCYAFQLVECLPIIQFGSLHKIHCADCRMGL